MVKPSSSLFSQNLTITKPFKLEKVSRFKA